MTERVAEPEQAAFDPVQLAVMANRVESIVREMTNTVLLTACSSVVGMARDFSCSILTSRHEILAAGEAIPLHVFGGNIQGEYMVQYHPDFREGDAFLANDPYTGNTHAADHTILVPVFHEGVHVFTTVVKVHQADCGNSVPTTYFAAARDIYEEGALIFPFVRIQSDYKNNSDIINMCMTRIRVSHQWYGDYLAAIGAARSGERSLKAFIAKFGLEAVKNFVDGWLDYSERRTAAAIRALPRANIEKTGRLDPIGEFLPDGVSVKVKLKIDPEQEKITVDLRDNPDCVDAGVNQCRATATACAIVGVFNCLEDDLPMNSGSLRRVEVLLRENCVVGIPEFPHSASACTTLLSDVIVNMTQLAFAELGQGFGLAEGNLSYTVGTGVISGTDWRKSDARYINQIFLMGGGGPASATSDGMHYLFTPPAAGLVYRDSVEIDEQRFPIIVKSMRLLAGSGGAGRRRGGLATRVEFGPRMSDMVVMAASSGIETAPRGAQGGHDSFVATNTKISRDGEETALPGYVAVTLQKGDFIVGVDNGGGGYGDPRTRDPILVLEDVREGYETLERAREVYLVELICDSFGLPIEIDETRTLELRGVPAA
jgi:N-methylhydantoinase B